MFVSQPVDGVIHRRFDVEEQANQVLPGRNRVFRRRAIGRATAVRAPARRPVAGKGVHRVAARASKLLVAICL